LLKSVHIYRSYHQNKTGGPFFGTPGISTHTVHLMAQNRLIMLKCHYDASLTMHTFKVHNLHT